MINQEQAHNAILQVRDAHRLSAAFYERMLQALDNMAGQLNCDFYSWSPLYFNLPSRSSTQPSRKWVWDFFPLIATQYIYSRCPTKETQLDDLFIEFEVIIDACLEHDYREEHNIKGQPNPLTLPDDSGSILRVYIHRPYETSEKSFEDSWDNSDYPKTPRKMQNVGENIKAVWLEWPLSDLLSKSDEVFKIIKKYCQ